MLIFFSDNGSLKCRVCSSYPALAVKGRGLNRFASPQGCQSLKTESIESHLRSVAHLLCVRTAAADADPSTTPMATAVQNMMDESTLERMVMLFNTAYYVAWKEKPFSDFRSLVELQRKNGLTLGDQYLNDKACKQFVDYIADEMFDKMLQEMSVSPFLGVMVDSSADIAQREHCNVFVRYIEEKSKSAVNVYFDTMKMEGGTAIDYYQATHRVLDESLPGWQKSTVGIATDGASVMTGRHNGLAARLKEDMPGLIAIHCVAHNLQLAIMDASKDVDYIAKKFDPTLKKLFNHYHFSPKRQRSLQKTAADALKKPSDLRKLTQWKNLRWAACEERLVDVLLTDWLAIVADLSKEEAEATDGGATAKGLRKTVASARFLGLLHFIADLFNTLSILSKAFQSDGITISDVPGLVERTVKNVKKMRRKAKRNVEDFQKSYNAEDGTFKGVSVSMKNASRIEADRSTLLDATINHLEDRFRSVMDDPVLSSCCIFNPLSWPDDIPDGFGHDELATLADAFGKKVSAAAKYNRDGDAFVEDLVEEWDDLLQVVVQPQRRPGSFADLNRRAHMGQKRFPLLASLLELVDVMPVQTACVERGFSTLNRIKTKHRSSMEEGSLTALMLISSNGQCLEEWKREDAEESVRRWFSDTVGTRHIHGHRPGSGRLSKTPHSTASP